MVNALKRSTSAAVAAEDHPVRLQGLGVSQRPGQPVWEGGTAGPSLCVRKDQDVVPAILRELTTGQCPGGLLRPNSPEERLHLPQPVQRRFTLALLEAVCDPWGQPTLQARVDEARVHSAGLVVRRWANGGLQGWRSQLDPATGEELRGWIPFAAEEEETLDPDPELRPPPLGGHPALANRLLPQLSRLRESTSALFLAPPAVASATGRTILYGLVPLTSFEHSELPPPPAAPVDAQTQSDARQALVNLLPYFLREGSARSGPSPSAAQRLQLRAVAAGLETLGPQTSTLVPPDSVSAVIQAVQQLAFHFRVFASPALMAEFERITLDANTAHTCSLAAFLRQAHKVVIAREADASVILPVTWGAISPSQHQRLLALFDQQMQAQLRELSAAEGRFAGTDQLYQVRAFVRLRRPDGCPPRIVWSAPSNPFTIAPWYEPSDTPPLRIELPDLLDPQSLRSLKPNVTFQVPPRLFKLLSNTPEDLLKGKDNKGGQGPDLQWLCGFNIPIITICAFLVLNIVLGLFNLIFWWLFSVKICIPFPRPRPSPPPPP